MTADNLTIKPSEDEPEILPPFSFRVGRWVKVAPE